MSADLAVKWLIDAYMRLSKLKNDMIIVPVMISYDRIFEQGNLSQEMITGEQKDYTIGSTFQSLFATTPNEYGEAHVKYLEPINLKSFLTDDLKIESLKQDNIDLAGQQLTEHLLRTQQKNTPITLNSIVSACILQEAGNIMELKKLIEKATMIYEYIKVKSSVVTYM